MIRRLPLRFELPLILLVTLAVILGTSLASALWHARKDILDSARTDLQAEVGHLLRMAERELHRSPGIVEADLTHAATDPRVRTVALIGPDGRVLMANRFAWKGEPAVRVLNELPEDELRPQGSRVPRLTVADDGDTLYALATVFLHRDGSAERSATRGLLYMAYDLRAAYAAGQADVVAGRLPEFMGSIVFVLLLGVWLYRHLSRPLHHLDQAAKRLAAGVGGPSIRASGPLEIVRLTETFNHMEAQIQANLAALRDSETRYRRLFDAHPLPLWVQDSASGALLAVNEAAIAHYGYPRERFLALTTGQLATTPEEHPDAAGVVRHRRADGSIIEVELISHPVDWLGHQADLVSAHDVTARRQAERDLRLAAAAFETSEAIMVTDAQGFILRINQAFTRITGYDAGAVAGQTPRLLKSGHQDAAFYDELWAAITGPGHWEGEIWNRHSDGHVYPQWLSVRAVRDESGTLTHFVSNFFDLSERKAAEQAIHRLSNHDALTDLPNRSLFRDRLTQALVAARRGSHFGAVLQLDIDRFKAINDARGHALGDELLRRVAERLQDGLREGDTLARLGADEFAVLLPNLRPPADAAARAAHHIAEKLRNRFEQAFEIDGTRYHIAASIGVTLFPKGQDGADDLLRETDTALYQAKASGRNTVCFFEAAMGAQAQARFALESELRQAIENDELVLYLQPQCGIDGRLEGAEALVRWRHPQRGLVPPGLFIPVAEDSGLIVPLGDWVLTRCCELLARQEMSHLPLRIAVNVSPRQFRQADFVQRVRHTLASTGADPTRLLLEVTEGVMLDNLADTVGKMSELAALGIHFSIDDFGTGYSSLAYLKRLPIHELKIDKAFIQDAPSDPNDAALVDAILAVARHLNLRVVAEGVETEDQAAFLRSRGPLLYQGYLTGRPEPAEQQLDHWLASQGQIFPAGNTDGRLTSSTTADAATAAGETPTE
mgnify:CR=1 FL=1